MKPSQCLDTRVWCIALVLSIGMIGQVGAADGQSYQGFLDWIGQNSPSAESIPPGTHLTSGDRTEFLEPLIPRAAWQYYIFDGMDMEVALPGHYPAPPEWGANIDPNYKLDERGVLVGFKGGGFPFDEIRVFFDIEFIFRGVHLKRYFELIVH